MRGALTRIGAISAKEFKHLLRDPRTLAAVLLLPVVQLLLFAYAISFDVKNVTTVIVDADKTPASRAYVQTYRASEFFQVIGEADDLGAVDRLFDRNQARIVVVVPSGFGRTLAAAGQPQVAVYLDGSEPNAARIGAAYSIALNRVYGQQVAVEWADRQGLDLRGFGQLEPRVRTWYNPERRSSDFLIPGLMVVILTIVTLQQTAVTMVRERDQGTDEQMAISPLTRPELMIGKLLPWTGLAFADLAAITVTGVLAFHLPVRGDLAALAVGAGLFVFSCLGIGLVISVLAPSMESANMLGLLISMLPSFMLSGFAFPLESIPLPLQVISHLFPARYMVTVSRGVFLKGSGFDQLWPELLALAAYAVIVVGIAVLLQGRRRR